MKNEEFIKKLVEVGLLQREARIYLALLNKSSFTATEIAKVSGIPRQKIYEILDNIIKKGICIEKVGKIKRYKAVNPESVFRGLIEQYKGKEKLALELSNDLSSLHKKNRERVDPLDYIQVLRVKSRIVEKVESLERMTKYEVVGFNKPPYAMNIINQDSVSKREEFNKLKIGIKYKSIYEVDDARNLDFLKNIEKFISAGEEVRIANELPMKMMIFDDKIVIIALQDKITSKSSLTTMIVEHPDLAKTLKETFNLHWQKAMTLEEFKIKGKI